MYGSQFHFEQMLAAKKFNVENKHSNISPLKLKMPLLMKASIIFIAVTFSFTTFASPSIPKISNPNILAAYIK